MIAKNSTERKVMEPLDLVPAALGAISLVVDLDSEKLASQAEA